MYHGYYIKGLIDLYGIRYIEFNSDGFQSLSLEGLSFIDLRNNKRYFIDTQDSDEIELNALYWSDIYAKVNLNINKVPNKYVDRVCSISPGFSIQFTRDFKVIAKSLYSCRKYYDYKRIITSYYQQFFNRIPLESYVLSRSSPDKNFIFLATSVWAPDDACNLYRSIFMEISCNIEWVNFEGGFTPPHREDEPYAGNYQINKRYNILNYIKLVKKSSVVFNTPAVLDCHGWKFGEYYSLGKAIISTPIKRMLPVSPVHEKNIHFVDGSRSSIRDAIFLILKDTEYRKYLEKNSIEYFSKYLSPTATVMSILNEENKSYFV